jgi:hypothetical protein
MVVMPLYTPFMANVGQMLGASKRQQTEADLAGSAYMGDSQAMEQLMSINPQLGMQIQQRQQQEEQTQIQKQAALETKESKKQEQQRKVYMENRELMDSIFKEASKIEDFGQAQSFVSRRFEENRPILGEMTDASGYTPEVHEQMKDVYREDEQEGAFAGTSMDAQVSNMLTRGVEDPAFRNTPDYARAWQLANEPKVIRTPTGDITMRPELPPVFEPPGAEAQKDPVPPEQAKMNPTSTETPGTPKGTFMIPGTEKISADQKAYNKDYALLKKSYDSMQNYVDVLGELGPQMAVGPLNAKDAQKLESAYARAMLDAKETNNLGVLNGPDLGIMRKLMGDPTGLGGQITGKAALQEGAEEAKKQITDNFSSLNEMMADTPVKTKKLEKAKPKPKVSGLSVTVDGKTYTFPDAESLSRYKEATGL